MLLTTVKHALSVSLYEGIIFLSYFDKEMSEKRCYAMETKIVINDNFLEMEIFQFFCCVHGQHPPLTKVSKNSPSSTGGR